MIAILRDILAPQHWLLFLFLFLAWMGESSFAIWAVSLMGWISVITSGVVMLVLLRGELSRSGSKTQESIKTVTGQDSKYGNPSILKLIHNLIFTFGLAGLFYHLDYLVLAVSLVVSQVCLYASIKYTH